MCDDRGDGGFVNLSTNDSNDTTVFCLNLSSFLSPGSCNTKLSVVEGSTLSFVLRHNLYRFCLRTCDLYYSAAAGAVQL